MRNVDRDSQAQRQSPRETLTVAPVFCTALCTDPGREWLPSQSGGRQ